jgi:hypothetical protein
MYVIYLFMFKQLVDTMKSLCAHIALVRHKVCLLVLRKVARIAEVLATEVALVHRQAGVLPHVLLIVLLFRERFVADLAVDAAMYRVFGERVVQ